MNKETLADKMAVRYCELAGLDPNEKVPEGEGANYYPRVITTTYSMCWMVPRWHNYRALAMDHILMGEAMAAISDT